MKAIPAFVVIFAASTALRLDASNVVTDWNAIASTTILKNAGKPSAASGVWFAYTGIAVYDAVNAITGPSIFGAVAVRMRPSRPPQWRRRIVSLSTTFQRSGTTSMECTP